MSYYLKDLLFAYNFLQNLYCLAQPVDTIFPENTAWMKGKVGYEYDMQIPKHYLNTDSTDYGETQVILGFKASKQQWILMLERKSSFKSMPITSKNPNT